eukprot:5132124-Prorocentrum_lima.AAC.1
MSKDTAIDKLLDALSRASPDRREQHNTKRGCSLLGRERVLRLGKSMFADAGATSFGERIWT